MLILSMNMRQAVKVLSRLPDQLRKRGDLDFGETGALFLSDFFPAQGLWRCGLAC